MAADDPQIDLGVSQPVSLLLRRAMQMASALA
jgi:hypothetical protein